MTKYTYHVEDIDEQVYCTEKQHTKTDNINHPSHYAGKVECIDCLESATEGLNGIEAVCTANAIKYLYRWKKKNGIEDLEKAKWYINRLIETLEQDDNDKRA